VIRKAVAGETGGAGSATAIPAQTNAMAEIDLKNR
jgi:hypothetical protein